MAPDVRRRKEGNGKNKLVKSDSKEESSDEVKPKYGPLPTFRSQRIWARGVMALGVLAFVYFSAKPGKEITFAKQKEVYEYRGQEFDCSEEYKTEVGKYSGCAPKRCGRLVSDNVITSTEAAALLNIAKRGLSVSGATGGASILDLHSGAVSYDKGFVNVYKLEEAANMFSDSDFTVYKIVKTKIQNAVAHHFGLNVNALYLTHPTFFSCLTSAPPMTVHDEYWHTHVDKDTYEAFHYTSILYLTDFGKDFEGGRFVFVDNDNTNRTVEPRVGRLSMFSSGSENTHFVERVTSGTRYAITVSFTCNKKYAISNPTLPKREM